MKTDSEITQRKTQRTVDELRDDLSAEHFSDWYRERQHRQNIENGTPYFNEVGHVPDPDRHSPSKLLQCHRKTVYKQCNAPAEQPDPDGIFWFGSQFEDEIAFPFLECAVTGPNTYVRNTIWIDFTIETDLGDIRIKGATDPVIVDRDSVPILPTEIKTKSSVENTISPNQHHKAQLHAYMAGLSEEYGIDVTEGILMYGSRTSLDVKFFPVGFDDDFWSETVINWAKEQTEYRLNDQLPPANPEFDWECNFCSYAERCGRGDSGYEDVGVDGLLPNFKNYPSEKILEYLRGNEHAKLPPTLAQQYSELAERFPIYDWQCIVCGSVFGWGEIDQEEYHHSTPMCPSCTSNDIPADLTDSSPVDSEQYREGSNDA